jgi:TRAP-type C4-dicarboxylate transport system permease small subunit
MTEPTPTPPSGLQKFEHLAETLASHCALWAAVLIFTGVVLRNTLSSSPSWITEIPTYLFIWAVFMALAGAFSKGPQLGLDILVRRLPQFHQRVLQGLGSLAMFVISAAMSWLGFELFLRQWSTGAVSNTALRFPLCWVTLAMVLGFSLLWAHAGARLMKMFKGTHADRENLP